MSALVKQLRLHDSSSQNQVNKQLYNSYVNMLLQIPVVRGGSWFVGWRDAEVKLFFFSAFLCFVRLKCVYRIKLILF